MRIFTGIAILAFFTHCTHQGGGNSEINFIPDRKLAKNISEYLSLPEYYQNEKIKTEILKELISGTDRLEGEIQRYIRSAKDQMMFDSVLLHSISEPVFGKGDKELEKYRLIVFSELQNRIRVYEIEQDKQHAAIRKKKLQILCGPPIISGKPLTKDCFEIVDSAENIIDEKKWTEFTDMIRESAYWDFPVNHFSRDCFDGENWTIEGVKDDRYKKISSYCPGYYNVVKIIGEKIMKLN
ncbi:MAG TPA: hypothetical protein PKE06_18785 [Flavilitoribacter sp.]|nr:hypothetical protein [Flavilitoribacter sp.]HMQ91010.1 hypothetical protein [Flavilitoribacter sp.]